MEGIDIDGALAALAEPTRRRVVELLGQGPRASGALADALAVSPPAMSRHLKVLREGGLVDEARDPADNRVRVYRLRPEGLRAIQGWLRCFDAVWTEQLDALRAFAQEQEDDRP